MTDTQRRGEGPERAELVPQDDAIIGRAFRWSAAVIVLAGGAVGAAVWLVGRPAEAPPTTEVTPVDPVAPTATADPPDVRFTDVTSGAGLDFLHVNGAEGDKLLPETMGGGCAFLDYDGDGDQDLLLVNSATWEGGAGSPAPTAALYRNDGTGRFEDVTAAAGLDVTCYGMGVAAGDYDNDGDADVYLTALGPNRLLRNDGGRYTDVTAAAGVAGDAADWSTGAGFFDADSDGDLDLFVCNYVRWTRDIDLDVDFRLTGVGRAYGPPTNFEGSFCRLYRNDGDGTFTDVSAAAGIEVANPATGVPAGKALGLTFVDVGSDGRPDVVVANDTVANFLFRNEGGEALRFTEVGAATGLAYGSMGNATGAMGIDAGYYREQVDGALGLGIGNFANEMSSLYVSQGDPWQFADEAIGEGLGGPSRQALSFGLFFFDYDLDGRLDLLQANGHLEEEINTVQPSQHYRQPAQLFWNAGPGARFSFVEVPSDRLGDLARPIVGRGAAYADIDGDGDLDVLLTQVAGPPLLVRNDLDHEGRHWLRVKLVGNGTTGNRDAIGAALELSYVPTGIGFTGQHPDGPPRHVQRRQVMPTRSYLSQVELPVTFGLGRGASGLGDVRLSITWPDGTVQQANVQQLDRQLVIVQP